MILDLSFESLFPREVFQTGLELGNSDVEAALPFFGAESTVSHQKAQVTSHINSAKRQSDKNGVTIVLEQFSVNLA